MKQNVLTGLLSLLLSLPIQCHAEISDTKKELVNELSQLIGTDFFGDKIATQAVNQLRAFANESGEAISDELLSAFNDALNEAIYEEFVTSGLSERLALESWGFYYSESELQQLIDFYRSDIGKKVLYQQPFTERVVADTFKELVPALESAISKKLEDRLLDSDVDSKILENFGWVDRSKNRPRTDELHLLRQEVCNTPSLSNGPRPYFRGLPDYPFLARSHSIEGWVDIVHTIEEDGTPSSIRILKSSTGTLFDDAAVASVKLHRYCPGERYLHKRVRIRFEMEKEKNHQTELD